MYTFDLSQRRFDQTMSRALILLSVVIVSNCQLVDDDEDAPQGNLVVPFELGAGKSCEDVGIESVKATLDEDAYSEEVACSEEEIRFEDIEIGVYAVKVYGYNSEGVAVMDSAKEDEVKVVKNNTTKVDPPVVLSDAPAKLKLRWNLGYGNCKIWKIDGFQLKIWSEKDNKLLLETKLSCTLNDVDADSYRTVDDPDRELDGGNVGVLQVQPVDSNGSSVGSDKPAEFTFNSPGPGGVIKLSVTCDSEGCKGSGEAD